MRTPDFIPAIFKSLLWKVNTIEKKIFLTFDDGPTPDVTHFVLEQLKIYNAKATFFCIGNNVKSYPHIYETILLAGHQTGNHTQHHLNGWNTNDRAYFKDVLYCNAFVHSKLFRPPYGKIRFSQMSVLQKQYVIVMWDVLSKDYDDTITNEKCLQRVIKQTRQGSIIVFHDSLKAKEKLYYALPKVLDYFSEKGFVFDCLYS